jgi:hypothetical protein
MGKAYGSKLGDVIGNMLGEPIGFLRGTHWDQQEFNTLGPHPPKKEKTRSIGCMM